MDFALLGLAGSPGSPASFVAPSFVPAALPEHPVIVCVLAKLSLVGAGGDGGAGGGPGGGLLLVRLYPNEVSASRSLAVIALRQLDGIAGSMIPMALQVEDCFQ